MARAQFAFRFDPEGAAKPFRTLARRDAGRLSTSLRRRARAAVREASPSLREALIAMRYDQAWTGLDPDEADRDAKCFVIALIADCAAVPSLGRPDEAPLHVVLETLLPDAGWGASDVACLMRGDGFGGYLHAVGLAALSPTLTGLADMIGWVSHARAQALLAELAAVESYFVGENARHGALLARIVPAWGPKAADLARQAYERAVALLSAAGSEQALLLVLD